MTNSILLQNVSPEEFSELINKSIKSQLDDLKKCLNTNNPDEILTRKEACEFLKVNSSTLFHWQKAGKIQAFGLGARRYYKKADLIECLTLLKR
ncbi:helix-turn-helix domain-containing protein [Flavobacterium psychrophilum]|nr:helix-turn-helix domain-containing protein [Flavobacterium psychrophilum]EKT4534582.1 helix-turn-helix domain-containing protein [Flavobacterium psychrophilum]EKT4544811.1 helix-turn-helix domain-containing protein [Flavobacterium psychrophilum]EKT4548149.1 helix-turn-helix domain-containing protein [Flavobacterium psychrophilum]MBF1997378.1 helix-turn-helix domain-containing protein [Flavobacterium psychrophilum]